MTSRPRVYARVRPLNETELTQGSPHPVFYSEKGHPDVLVFEKETQNEKIEHQKTRFDRVFNQDTCQEEIFNTVGTEILNTLFSGYNATVFAYGQTGSGKSFTQIGAQSDPESYRSYNKSKDSSSLNPDRGLIPRCVEAIFEKLSSNEDITDSCVEMSMVQIYQERVQDLFQQRRQLEIHLDRTGQYIARDAKWHTVSDPAQALSHFYEGIAQRATNATEMNLVSSRSHIIVMMRLQWDEPSLPGSRAQLNLVDLAGSEKLYQSGATGEVMKETIAINKSLSALGNVVSRLVDASRHKDRRVHVPYKDSKLTYLLQSSLGGSNLIHFILAMSASSLWRAESTSTVEFGKRALQLVLRPVRNPIDYKRLEEMEAMIETMRNRIRNLEEELSTKAKAGDHAGAQQAFLQIKQLQQEGDLDATKKKHRRRSSGASAGPSRMRSRAELSRIIANLPETLEDLTSHCILFPNSREDFRNLGGLEKLVHLIDRSPSTFYRAHAAHTVAHVIDDEGRLVFAKAGGIEVVERLLLVKEERCKEAACAAIEAVVRGCQENKLRVTRQTYEAIVDLTYGYPNQQVQEAACTVLATLVDTNPHCRQFLGPPVDAVKKLLLTIKEAPEEVVHVTKAAATCIGRLGHGTSEMQASIREHGGIELLIDHVLFSASGDRDHQVPILGSYALVNLCCSNEKNMQVAQRHPRYDEVRFRLMEGLARAFGNNTVREGFARATASETASPFPYHGITVTDKWSTVTCGGRPIFSSFHENPQFFLYVEQDTNVSLMIQDTLYEIRMQQKMRNATVYMGLAVFQGEAEFAQAGLKQLDFHGRMVEIAKFTSNCENVLHCTLKKSDAPYIVVPFASQRGRQTNFALSAFGDKPIDLLPIPETTGWYRQIVHGAWTQTSCGGGDTLLWRNNPQILLSARENTKVVFVLSYLSLDFQRCALDRRDDGSGAGDEEKVNNRPRMHGRLYKNNFAPDKRYSKHFAALPTSSSFVAGNTYSSNSYVTVSANLKAGENYAFVPFTETPVQDTFRLCVFTVSDEVTVKPLKPENEWKVTTMPGVWNGEQLRLSVRATGKMSFAVNSPGVILRASVFSADQQKLFSPESLFSGETWVEIDLPSAATSQPCTIIIEGFVRTDKQSPPTPASGQAFHLISYLSDEDGLITLLPGDKPTNPTYPIPRTPPIVGSNSKIPLLTQEEEENGSKLIGSADAPGFYPVTVGEEEQDPLDAAATNQQQQEFGAAGENNNNNNEGSGADMDDYDDYEDESGGVPSSGSFGAQGAGGGGGNNSGQNFGSNSNSAASADLLQLKEKNHALQNRVESLEKENSSLKSKLEQAEAQIESFKKAALMAQHTQSQYNTNRAAAAENNIISTTSATNNFRSRPQSSGGSFFTQHSTKTPSLPSAGITNSNNHNNNNNSSHGEIGNTTRQFTTTSSSMLPPGGNRGTGPGANRREITPLGQQQQQQRPPVAPPSSGVNGGNYNNNGLVRSNSASGRSVGGFVGGRLSSSAGVGGGLRRGSRN